MIVEEIREQLHQSSSYIISPNDIATEIFNRTANDIYAEVSEEYKEKVREVVAKKLGTLGLD